MKTKYLTPLLCLALAACALPLQAESNPDPLGVYPKNLARHHLGTNVFRFDATNQTYVPTEAAAAWLDDDIATGWPPAAGHSYYLISLPEPQLLSNFCVSAQNHNSGTISIYAGDEPAAPGAKSWTPLATDAALSSINERTMEKPFSRFAKYVLIETNMEETGPWYSIYLYGERPAISYSLEKRDQAISPKSVFGAFVHDDKAISLTGLYTGARVTRANGTTGHVAANKAIDSNPESGITLPSSATEAALIIELGARHQLHRISVLGDTAEKGRLDFFLLDPDNEIAASDPRGPQYIRVSNEITPVENAETATGKPAASITLDSGTRRESVEFPAGNATRMLVRWTGENDQPLTLREVDTFGDASLSEHRVSAPGVNDDDYYADYSKDGKAVGKEILPPVGEFLGAKTPFLPGVLGFPPILPPTSPPDEPPPSIPPPPEFPPEEPVSP